jgi:hypothetical protein
MNSSPLKAFALAVVVVAAAGFSAPHASKIAFTGAQEPRLLAGTPPARLLGYTSAPSAYLRQPVYASTLVGPGLAAMNPVDVSSDSQYYFILDAGQYRVVAVNRTTGNIDCQLGGKQGAGPGQFGDARALDYDAATNQLYVADTPNNRVEVFAFTDAACAASSKSAFTYISQFGSKGTGN